MTNGASPAKKAKKEESSSDDDSESDEEEATPAAKPAAKPAAEKMEEDSDDDSSEEEEEEEKPKAKAAAKPAEDSDDDSSDDSDEEEEEAVTKTAAKPAAKAPAKKEESSDDDDDSDSDDEEEEEEVPAKKEVEPEPELKIKNNKNNAETPQKGGHNKSFNGQGQLEGKKIFVHNVSEEATYEDFQASVEKFGECTDFFNPGRGFAFIEYSTNEQAAACIAGMDNTEVAGRTIQMNIAKPKGEKGNDRGGQGGRGGHNKSFSGQPEGSKIFVHNVSEEATYEDFQASVEKFGEVTDFFNPGRGFAFVEFGTPA